MFGERRLLTYPESSHNATSCKALHLPGPPFPSLTHSASPRSNWSSCEGTCPRALLQQTLSSGCCSLLVGGRDLGPCSFGILNICIKLFYNFSLSLASWRVPYSWSLDKDSLKAFEMPQMGKVLFPK